jgi:putative enterotoxin type A
MRENFEFKIVEKNNKEVEFLKNTAEKLQELNRELKEENDRYSEQQMNEIYKYYKNGGLVE